LTTYFADVLLPLAVPKSFTYRLPQNLASFAQVGKRVVVPFGRSKLYTGIILNIHQNPPKAYTAKYVDSFLESRPVVNSLQLKMWDWMANYYMCTRGEVYLAAVPSGLRLSSETNYIINPAFDGEISSFSQKELLLLEAINKREVMGYKEISELLEVKNINTSMKKLLDASAVMIMENLKDGYKPKIESFVSLSPHCRDDDGLEAAFKKLSRAPKQEEALMLFLQFQQGLDGEERIKKSFFRKKAAVSDSVIKELIRKDILLEEKVEVGRLDTYEGAIKEMPELTDVQADALRTIHSEFQTKDVVLLKGVTSSGKTEIYIRLIEEVIERKRKVLYMVPEIALTAQMINRLRAFFGDKVLVYHSKFNQNERVEIWNKLLEEKDGALVLGARSSIFLPLSDLELIVVDEEHENSFKQYDPAPRYNARDVAVWMGNLHGAKVILGSATPSFESLHNAESEKYGFVELSQRFGDRPKPQMLTASLKSETIGSKYFTKDLVEEIQASLDRKEQVILFQNRRGYAPILLCEVCGWAPECTRCDVSLTYHKSSDRLVCHYCGNKYSVTPTCSACGSNKMNLAGSGTERVEEEIQIIFPNANISRLDLDSTSSKYGYQKIIGDFEDGLIDILIGTQMVTKGLDFENVNLVAVLNADLLMKFPDFRANERAFQLMTQVAGRSGRRDKVGKVIIQSYDPSQWLIQQVMVDNGSAVYEREMDERKKFLYPPFTRLIKLTFRHHQAELVDYCSAEYRNEMEKILHPTQILGPEYPLVPRVKNLYNKIILLKITKSQKLGTVKQKIEQLNSKFFGDKEFKGVRLTIDVDPQ
jgi:primosomal protein N' (replication factor Y)